MGGGGWSLFMRLCLERPEGQQQEQHLKQQHATSAPQQQQRTTQKMTEKMTMEPTMIPTITGHLSTH